MQAAGHQSFRLFKEQVTMKWTIFILPLITCTILFAAGKEEPARVNNSMFGDTADLRFVSKKFAADSTYARSNYSLNELNLILKEKRPTSFSLGTSKLEREIGAWYFPGASDQRALIIAGVHGSELSSVEVAYALLNELFKGSQPYYSVIIVPTLFPDNAIKALTQPAVIGSVDNIGRYTYAGAVDPNRQMPSPGKAFDESKPLDHIGREIEKENQLLLKLIQEFKPHRLANLHAIRNPNFGGVYADPRTDHLGAALGFSSDSSLAVLMAKAINMKGGNVAGNNLKKKPTALYYKDPKPAQPGEYQQRNMTGAKLNANRGSGVSLGTWGSTAVVHEENPSLNRPAMRILTIEYPGCKRPADYKKPNERMFQEKQVLAYAAAIKEYFLGEHFIEELESILVQE